MVEKPFIPLVPHKQYNSREQSDKHMRKRSKGCKLLFRHRDGWKKDVRRFLAYTTRLIDTTEYLSALTASLYLRDSLIERRDEPTIEGTGKIIVVATTEPCEYGAASPRWGKLREHRWVCRQVAINQRVQEVRE